MLATMTLSPDPQVGMVPIAEIVRDRFEPFGIRVTELDAYQATVEGELEDIIDGIRSLDGFSLRRAGSHAVIHIHIPLGELDTTDPLVSAAYDEVCERFLHPDTQLAGDRDVAL